MIIIKDVSKRYQLQNQDDVFALKEINLNLPDKGLVFIVGKSGSGKSTLLNLLGGLDDIYDGTIELFGYRLNELSSSKLNEYRKNIVGIVFQEYNLIPELNVGQNIQLTKSLQGKKYDKNYIESLLSYVELSGFSRRKINQLSGGQKQRVAIARALSKDSKIILADEPTGSLDFETGESVIQLFKKISHDKLVIVVSHDHTLASRYADQVVELADGQIVKHDIINFSDDTLFIESNVSVHITPNPFFKIGLNLAIHSVKKKFIQSFFSVMYIMLTISIIFITMSTMLFRFDELFVNVVGDNELNRISIEKRLETSNYDFTLKMNDHDVIFLQEQFVDLKLNPVKPLQIDYQSNLFYKVNQNNEFPEYTYTFGVSKVNLDIMSAYEYTLLAGSMPANRNEVLITKYTYDILKTYDWKIDGIHYVIDEYQDIIGVSLYQDYYDGSMIVSGIIDTGDYAKEISDRTKSLTNGTLDSILYSVLYYGGHNNIYVNQLYYENLTSIPTMGQYEYMEFTLNDEESYVSRFQSLSNIKDLYYLFEGYENIGLNQGIISLDLLNQLIDYNDLNEYIYDYLLEDVKNDSVITKASIYDALVMYYPEYTIEHYNDWVDDTYYNLYVNLIYITLDELTVDNSVKDLSKLKYQNPFGPTGLEHVGASLSEFIKDFNLVLSLSIFYDNQSFISQEDFQIVGISIDSRSALTLKDDDLDEMMVNHYIGKYNYIQMEVDQENDSSTLNIAQFLLNQDSSIKYMDTGFHYQILNYTKTNVDILNPILVAISIGFVVILVVYIWLITLLNLQMQRKNMGIFYALGMHKKVFIVSFITDMVLIDLIATLCAIPLIYYMSNFMNFVYAQTADQRYNVLNFNVGLFVITVILLLLVTTVITITMTLLKLKTNPYKLMKSK